MALQQKNSSLPKHLQHMRLQKEQEEEQWISGEELCTEGSSDEEASTTHKDNLIKKSRSKTKVASPRDLFAKSTSSLSTASSSGNSEDKSVSGSERSISPNSKKCWRPKRGESFNMSAEKWKLESDYKETMEALKKFKDDFKIDEIGSITSDEPEESLCDGIDIMDCQINEFFGILQKSRKNRQDSELEICKSLDELNFSPETKKSSKKFQKMCKLAKPDKKTEDNFVQKLKREVQNIRARLNRKYNFNNSKVKMNFPSLTDEEKIRLKDLLVDIDTVHLEQESQLSQNVQSDLDSEVPVNKNNTIVFENAFRSTDEESNHLNQINQQLKTLLEMCTNADLKGKNYESNNSGPAIDENCEWKECSIQTEKKIRNINMQLKKLKDQPTEEKELLDSLEN